MGKISTRATDADVTAFIDAVPDERRRTDARRLRALMEEITGATATMWGPSIIGFGSRPYTNTTGTNDWFVVGFSPRKAATTVYGIHDGYGPVDPLLERLGPHTTGKGCVYLKSLDAVDGDALAALIRQAWQAGSASQ
jgi:hypothetical protein